MSLEQLNLKHSIHFRGAYRDCVDSPRDGMISFSVQSPGNSFEMSVEAARGFAKTLLRQCQDGGDTDAE